MSTYDSNYNEFGDLVHDSYNPRLNKGIYVPEPDPIIWNETLLTLSGYRFSYSRVTTVTDEETGNRYIEPAGHYAQDIKWGLYIAKDVEPALADTRWLHDFDTLEDLMAFMTLHPSVQPITPFGLLISLEYAWRLSLIMQLPADHQLPVIDDHPPPEFTSWFIENCINQEFKLTPYWADTVIHYPPTRYTSVNPSTEEA